MKHRSLLAACAALLVLTACDDSDSGLDAGDGSDSGARDASADSGADAGPDGSLPARNAATVFFIGHSLINFDMPAMLDDLAESAGVRHEYAAQIGNGAPLQFHWEHADMADGLDAQTELPTGRYDVLVMTEGIPLPEHLEFSHTLEYAGRFYDLAMQGNPATQVYLYETWYDVTDPAWRENIDAQRPLWEGIIEELDARGDGPDVLLVPGGAALGRLVDRIEAGGVPGLTSRHDLFVDEVHLNDAGNYFIALVHFATIYQRSPVGLTRETTSAFGRPFDAPSAEVALIMQEIAWEVVSTEPLTRHSR